MRDVVGYESFYKVDEYGNIYSLINGHFLKQSFCKRGYPRVWLYLNKKRKEQYIHRIVANTFLGFELDETVNHKDGNKRNNFYKNLEWLSNKENMRHAFKTGIRKNNGGKKNKCYSVPQDVLSIGYSLINDGFSIRCASNLLNIDRETLRKNYIRKCMEGF